MKPQKPAIAPISTIQVHSAQTLPEILTAIVEACKLVPDKLQLQIQFIVNSPTFYGNNNTTGYAESNSGVIGRVDGDFQKDCTNITADHSNVAGQVGGGFHSAL